MPSKKTTGIELLLIMVSGALAGLAIRMGRRLVGSSPLLANGRPARRKADRYIVRCELGARVTDIESCSPREHSRSENNRALVHELSTHLEHAAAQEAESNDTILT